MNPTKLDHVAYWLAEREPVAEFLTSHLGMHVIDQTDKFTLLGSNARRGKLTLFTAEGPRERGALMHVALRVSDLDAALAELPGGVDVERPRPGEAYFDVGAEGVRLGLVEAATDVDYDLDHVALFSANPEETAGEYASLGFAPAAPAHPARRASRSAAHSSSSIPVSRGRRRSRCSTTSRFSSSRRRSTSPPRTTSASRSTTSSMPPNTYAVFLWGPERVRVEYVEHKPTFSLT